MRPNLSALIKDEVVRRFEDVVKEEVRLHNLSIKKTENDIREINEKIESLISKSYDTFKSNTESHAETRRSFSKERELLENDFKLEREFVASSRKEIDIKIKDFEGAISSLCSKSDLNLVEKVIFKYCTETYYNMLQSVDSFKQYLYENNSSIQKDLLERMKRIENSTKNLEQKLDLYRSSSMSEKVESDGVLRELQVYKKSMFIIDKKIENIYTLIERLSARISL